LGARFFRVTLLPEVVEELDLAAVHPSANTSSKNCNGATDMPAILPCESSGFGRLHAGAASRKV
jgi:hypothetical protein